MTGRHEQQVGWTVHYDGPRRAVVLISPRDGHHVVAMTEVEELAHPNLRACRSSADADGPLLWLRIRLDERGAPLAWLSALDPRLLGSLSVWPKPDSHYLWRHDPMAFGELRGLPARELGPVRDVPPAGDPEWVLGLRRAGQADERRAADRYEPRPVPHRVHTGWAPDDIATELLFEGEGGSVSTGRLGTDFIVVVSEAALVDGHGAGSSSTTYRFASAEDRAAFLQDRRWSARG
jgi:hypothetical protein